MSTSSRRRSSIAPESGGSQKKRRTSLARAPADSVEDDKQKSAESAVSSADALMKSREFLGFHPLSFVDDVANATSQYCADATEFIRSQIQSKHGRSAPLDRGVKEFEATIQKAVDKSFDGFELYVAQHVLKPPEDNLSDVQKMHVATVRDDDAELPSEEVEVQVDKRLKRQFQSLQRSSFARSRIAEIRLELTKHREHLEEAMEAVKGSGLTVELMERVQAAFAGFEEAKQQIASIETTKK